jgi:ubiquinone/menaquinone biosynthesis C-methylase UbiE
MNNLYKDFQWEIIFKILSEEKHLNLFIDKEKQTIENIDEKVVDNILSQKYMKGNNLDILKSMFNTVLMHHVDSDDNSSSGLKLPYLDNSIINLLNSFKLASLKNTSEGFAVLSNFKSIDEMVIIKTAKNKSNNFDILYEYFIGSIGINKLRNLIPNFAYTLAIFKCSPLNINNNEIKDNTFCNGKDSNNRFYVVYEKIPGISLDTYLDKITLNDIPHIISYILQIILSLQVAQQEIGFVHYDLHTDNIMLRKLKEPIVVDYNINNKIYKIETDSIPTIIDYGFSHFSYGEIQFGMVDMPNIGIKPTKTAKGYDLYKILMFILSKLYNKNSIIFEEISWIVEYYDDKEDPYGIHKNIKNKNFNNLNLSFRNGYKNYFSVTEKYPLIYNSTPISFINWLYNKKINIFKKYIKLTYNEYNEQSDKILDMYQAKINGQKIFKINLIDEIKNCDILEINHKSYIINKFIILEFQNVLKKFGSHIKDTHIIENKVKLLNSKNEKNKNTYSQNDDKLLKFYNDKLNEISSFINVDKIYASIKTIKNNIDIKRLNESVKFIQQFNEIYTNYKLFIDYSKLSKNISIDGDYEKLFYIYKNIYQEFSTIKSEFIFNLLYINLNIINRVIYDFINEKNINPSEWVVTNSFKQSLQNIQFVLNDIKFYYPDIKYACETIEKFIFKLIITANKYYNIIIYLPTRSLNQINICYKCDSDRIVSLIKKSMKRNISNEFISNFINESINRNKNDEEIYNSLREYANTDTYEEGRSQSRVKHINFLFSNNNFKNLRENRNFKYLDIGGGDGSISYAIGNYMKLNKENIVSADVQDWFNIDSKKNKDITYITINENGRLPFSDQQFSVITAFQVFHHIEDINDRLQELSRIIKRGGLLVIREHDVNNECTRMIIDIEHSLHEMTTKPTSNNTFLKEYNAYYKSAHDWTVKIESFGFKYIRDADYKWDMRIKNPTRTYYAMYERI